MSKLVNQASRSAHARRTIASARGVASLVSIGLLISVGAGGCSQEQRDNWTWNPFEKKSKATPPDAGTKARRPAPPPPPATASNTAKPSAEDQKADQVNRDVNSYAGSFPENSNRSKPSNANSRTPAIDDDHALTDASAPPRAQRTSARPQPVASTPPPSSPPVAPAENTNSGLTPMQDDHSSNPYITSISDDQPVATPIQDVTNNSSTPATTEIAMTNPESNAIDGSATSNDRPPVLGGINVEAGDETDDASSGKMAATDIDDANNNTKITPTPIRPIETSTPPAKPENSAAQPEPAEISNPIDTPITPPVKPATEQSKPKPPIEPQTPFEDRDEGAAASEPEPKPVTPITPEPKAIEPMTPEPKPEPKIEPRPEPKIEPIAPKPIAKTERTPPAPIEPAANEVKPAIDSTAKKIANLEAIVARQPNNIDRQLELRTAYVFAGDNTRALAPTPGMSADVQTTVIEQIKSMIAAKSSDGRTAPDAANTRLASAEAIRASAAEKADLQIPRVVLCNSIRAFRKYSPFDPPTFTVGGKNNIVLVYIEVENFKSTKMDDGQYKTLLSLRESLHDARGRELWGLKSPPIEDVSREVRRDFFLATPERKIPPSLPAGEYYYKVEIEDLQSNKINSAKTAFTLMVPKN